MSSLINSSINTPSIIKIQALWRGYLYKKGWIEVDCLREISKSNEKMKKALIKSKANQDWRCYTYSKAARPFILKILKNFTCLSNSCCELIQVLYIKSIEEIIPNLNKATFKYELSIAAANIITKNVRRSNRLVIELKYINKYRNNLLKFKKKCEDKTISYYNYLPGNTLSLDIRSKIISFISSVPMFIWEGKNRKLIHKELVKYKCKD